MRPEPKETTKFYIKLDPEKYMCLSCEGFYGIGEIFDGECIYCRILDGVKKRFEKSKISSKKSE